MMSSHPFFFMFCVSSARPSSPESSYATSETSYFLASSAMASQLSLLAAWISGFPADTILRPSSMTSGLSLTRIKGSLVFSETAFTASENFAGSPDSDLTAIIPIFNICPTLSNSKSEASFTLASSSSDPRLSLTTTEYAVG